MGIWFALHPTTPPPSSTSGGRTESCLPLASSLYQKRLSALSKAHLGELGLLDLHNSL